VVGREHFPAHGPLLVVGNHFSFLDPVALLSVVPWPIEFVGGFTVPNAPTGVGELRRLWGYYPVYRGTGSQLAFRAAQAVFDQGGIMGIFPEGSSAHALLRPPRPGAAFMAARAQVPILPIGMDGLTQVFPALRRGKRQRVTVRVGAPLVRLLFPDVAASGATNLMPSVTRSWGASLNSCRWSDEGTTPTIPNVREAAQALGDYVWDDEPEG
jgi:1-acyl-sn-glycerol-3-phosphate acyltransferase